MKKLLAFFLVVATLLTLFGCVEKTPPFGWPSSLSQISTASADSCDQSDKDSVLYKASYFLIDPIVTQVQSISILIFDNIVGNPVYVQIIRAMLVLYLVIYGIMVTSGLVLAKLSDLIIRIIKIGVLLTLATNTSYEFFNKYLFKLFTDGSYQLLTIVTNPYCDTGTDQINFFAFFNYVIDTLFTDNIFLRLMSLLLYFPVGWIGLFVLLIAMVKYLFAIIKAIIAYLFAFTAVALLIGLAPIFIALILFDNTRELFDNWMKAILMFSLQPVILFAGIFFITLFVNDILQDIFVACNWKAIFSIYINFGSNFKFKLFSLYWYKPDTDLLSLFGSIIVLYLCTDLLGNLPSYIETLGFQLIGGKAAVMGRAGEIVGSAGEKIKGLVGMDTASKERRKRI